MSKLRPNPPSFLVLTSIVIPYSLSILILPLRTFGHISLSVQSTKVLIDSNSVLPRPRSYQPKGSDSQEQELRQIGKDNTAQGVNQTRKTAQEMDKVALELQKLVGLRNGIDGSEIAGGGLGA